MQINSDKIGKEDFDKLLQFFRYTGMKIHSGKLEDRRKCYVTLADVRIVLHIKSRSKYTKPETIRFLEKIIDEAKK